jgi:hypothetical protein
MVAAPVKNDVGGLTILASLDRGLPPNLSFPACGEVIAKQCDMPHQQPTAHAIPPGGQRRASTGQWCAAFQEHRRPHWWRIAPADHPAFTARRPVMHSPARVQVWARRVERILRAE